MSDSDGENRGARFGRALKRRVRAALPPLLFLALVGYFGWNATRGDRGLVAYAARQVVLKSTQAERDQAVAERDMWERRVTALRTSRLDPDALDEQARAKLNLADPNDTVVLYGPGNRLY